MPKYNNEGINKISSDYSTAFFFSTGHSTPKSSDDVLMFLLQISWDCCQYVKVNWSTTYFWRSRSNCKGTLIFGAFLPNFLDIISHQQNLELGNSTSCLRSTYFQYSVGEHGYFANTYSMISSRTTTKYGGCPGLWMSSVRNLDEGGYCMLDAWSPQAIFHWTRQPRQVSPEQVLLVNRSTLGVNIYPQ